MEWISSLIAEAVDCELGLVLNKTAFQFEYAVMTINSVAFSGR